MFEALKWSKYNFTTYDQEDNLIIYNFLNGKPSLTKIMKPDVEQFKKMFLTSKEIHISLWEKYAAVAERLLEAGILVDVDTDENVLYDAKYYKEVFDNKLVLIILPTGKCNFNCSYCLESEQSFYRGAMTVKSQNAILKFVQKQIHHHNELQVSWFGGEPLLEPQVIKYLSENFINICKARLIPYSAQITTNGYLLDDDTFDMLYKLKIYNYMITVDGFAEQHDKQRFTHGGKGTYNVIMQNLLRIRDNKKYKFAHINIRVNITKSVLDILDNFIFFLESLFSDDPRFSFTFVPAKNYSNGDNVDEDIFVDSEKVTSHLLKNKVYSNKLYPENLMSHLIAPGQGCSSALKNSYVITPDLKIFKCCAHYDMKSNNIGHIDSAGNLIIDETLHNKWYLANKFVKKTTDACRDCFYMPACPNSGKNCPAQYLMQGSKAAFCPRRSDNFITALTESVLYAVNKYPYITIAL